MVSLFAASVNYRHVANKI